MSSPATTLKVAYVDHEFHIKTRSTAFFIDILAQHFELTELWEDSWFCTPFQSLSELVKSEYDIIVFFQILPKLKDLKKIKCKNIIWVPMADQELSLGLHSRLCCLKYNIKIVCFCKKLYDHYTAKGFSCYYIQYFLKTMPRVKTDKTRVLAWIRTSVLDWKTIKKLIPENTEIVLRNSPDPGEQVNLPSEDDYKKFNINLLEGWLEKDEYDKIINSCNVFIAPRKFEGIGVSLLDTISRGMCVIASDTPTMNEYVQHGKTGFLFDLKKPTKLDFTNITSLCDNMYTYNEEKYEEWLKSIPPLINFIQSPPPDSASSKQLICNTIEYVIKAPLVFCKKAFCFILRKLNR